MHALAHRTEAIFWLGRPASMFGKTPPVLAGFLLGSPQWEIRELGLTILFAVCMQLIISSLNDVYDARRDQLTAPYLPIPAGLVSRNEACIAPLAAGLMLAATLWALAVDAGAVALIGLTACAGIAIGGIYGETKSSTWSPLLASTGSIGAVLWGWFLSDQEQLSLMLTAAAIMFLHGIFMNLVNQLRDSDKDPAAGNYTIGVRKGWHRTLFWAGVDRVVECGVIVALAVGLHAPARGIVAIAPLVALAYGLRGAATIAPYYRSTRLTSITILKPFRFSTFLAEIALLFVISPVVAIIVGSFMWLWYRSIRPIYERRIVSGDLARTATANA